MRKCADYLDELESEIDFNNIKFGRLITSFADFLKSKISIFNFDQSFLCLNVGRLDLSLKFFSDDGVLGKDIFELRKEIWREYDSRVDFKEKRFLRAMVICFYEDFESGSNAEDVLELIFSVVDDMEFNLCKPLYEQLSYDLR